MLICVEQLRWRVRTKPKVTVLVPPKNLNAETDSEHGLLSENAQDPSSLGLLVGSLLSFILWGTCIRYSTIETKEAVSIG